MPSVGDVFVTLRLDSSGFQAGVANAARGAAQLGQILDQFGRPIDTAAEAVANVGGRVRETGIHFHNAGQAAARFAAIGIEQVVPSLQGSRITIEGALRAVGSLAGGYSILTTVGIGAAAIIGGGLFLALSGQKSAMAAATEGVKGFDESLQVLQADIQSTIGRMGLLETASRFLDTKKGGPPGVSAILDLFRKRAAERVDATRSFITALEGAKLLEDPNAGPGGTIARRTAEAEATAIFALEKQIESFRRTATSVLVDDPLQKLLIGDFQRTQDLIDKVRELPGLLGEERAKLIGQLGAEAGQRQIDLRDLFSKQQGPGITQSLGLGEGNLIAGLRDIDQTTKEVAGFASEIDRLSRLGIPARDLFNLIAEGQQKVDERIGSLREKFADVPIVLEKIADLDKQFGQGSLQKGLDAVTRGFQNLKQGGFELETEMTQVTQSVDSFIPAASDAVTAADAMGLSVVRLTQGWRDFKFTLDAVIGSLQVLSGGEVAVAGPGNFQ